MTPIHPVTLWTGRRRPTGPVTGGGSGPYLPRHWLTASKGAGERGGRAGTMSRKGWALFGAVGVIWGIPFLLIKVADDGGVPVALLVFTRVFIGAVLLLPAAIRRGTLPGLKPRWRWVVALSVVEVILPWLLLSAAEQHLSSSVSGLILAVVPIVGIGVAKLAGDRDRLTVTRGTGLAIGSCAGGRRHAPGARGIRDRGLLRDRAGHRGQEAGRRRQPEPDRGLPQPGIPGLPRARDADAAAPRAARHGARLAPQPRRHLHRDRVRADPGWFSVRYQRAPG